MTVRDPTPDLAVKLAREKAGDFEWAFNRLVDIMVERMKGMPPPVRSLMAELVQESFAQLHQENQGRVALMNVRANAAP